MQCYKLRGVALELTGINDFQNSINENEWDEDWGVIWHCHLTLLSILYLVTSLFITIILFNKPWIFTWIKFFRSIALAQGWWMSMNINYVKSVNFASYNVRCTVIFFIFLKIASCLSKRWKRDLKLGLILLAASHFCSLNKAETLSYRIFDRKRSLKSSIGCPNKSWIFKINYKEVSKHSKQLIEFSRFKKLTNFFGVKIMFKTLSKTCLDTL